MPNIVFNRTKIVDFRFLYFGVMLIWWEECTRKKYCHQNKEPKLESEASSFCIYCCNRICYAFRITDPTWFNFPSVKWKIYIITVFAMKLLLCCQWVLQKWLIASNLALTEVYTWVCRISGNHLLCLWVSMSV